MAGVSATSQVYRFLATGFSVSERSDKGKWSPWSETEKANIIVTLDTKKNRIIIYSQEIQLYQIVNYQPAEENDHDLIYAFSCSDEDGHPFTISIITRKNQGNRKQLYIAQKDYMIMYNIVNYKG
jgi:hypothetical protein